LVNVCIEFVNIKLLTNITILSEFLESNTPKVLNFEVLYLAQKSLKLYENFYELFVLSIRNICENFIELESLSEGLITKNHNKKRME